MNPLPRHARRGKRHFHICHEASRPAQVDISVAWNADLVQDGLRQMTLGVEILALLVERIRLAIADVATTVRERLHEPADFDTERMVLPITSRVQPQHLSCWAGRRQRVQHRQSRRCPDACAQQHHGPVSGSQDETSSRRADVESVAHTDMISEESPCRPIQLDFHADSVLLRRGGTRERVASKKRGVARSPEQTQDHVLPGKSGRERRLAVRPLQRQRENIRRLLIDRGHR